MFFSADDPKARDLQKAEQLGREIDIFIIQRLQALGLGHGHSVVALMNALARELGKLPEDQSAKCLAELNVLIPAYRSISR